MILILNNTKDAKKKNLRESLHPIILLSAEGLSRTETITYCKTDDYSNMISVIDPDTIEPTNWKAILSATSWKYEETEKALFKYLGSSSSLTGKLFNF